MTLIRKPNEIQVASKIKALIYGQAGMGKTTMALSSPSPLLIDCDGGIQRVNPAHIKDTVQATCYEDVLAVLQEDLSAYKTIVIDTGGKLLDMMSAYIIKHNAKMGQANGSLTLQGYGARKAEFSQFCKLVMSLDKHLIFVAHRETRTEGDLTRYVPLFGGSSYDGLVTELDLVGYIEASGNKATITFSGTSRNDGKNTCNLPAVIDIPCCVDVNGNGLPNHFFEEVVIAKYNQHLAGIQKLSRDYAEVMKQLTDDIDMICSVETANAFVKSIDTYHHIGASKAAAGQLLARKIGQLGYIYNAETRTYTDPNPVTDEQ